MANPEVRWETVNPYPGLGTINSVAFGDGKFVAVGSDGLGVSDDAGRSWERLANLPQLNYTAVLYTNGQFVAVGIAAEPSADKVILSQDGRTWSSYPLTNTPGLLTLNYWKGMYVATGNDGVIATSTDARVWNTVTNWTDKPLRVAAANDERFIVVRAFQFPETANDGVLFLTTTNGVDWTEQRPNLPPADDPDCDPQVRPCFSWRAAFGLVHFQDKFVMHALAEGLFVGAQMRTFISTNGIDWSQQGNLQVSYLSTNWPNTLLRLNDHLVEINLLKVYGPFWLGPSFTTNAVDWVPFSLKGDRTNEPEPLLYSGAYGEGTYVLAGPMMLARGSTLEQMERIDAPTGNQFTELAASGESIVALQVQSPNLAVSTNAGRNFDTLVPPAGSGNLNAIEFAQEKFVAVGEAGTVIRVTNGSLSRRLSNTSHDLNDVVFGDGQWIAVGENGTIISSIDASAFSLQNSGTAITLNSITHGARTFVAVGNAGLILTSKNGQNWSAQGTEQAQDLLAVAYGNGRFVATGTNGVVHTSTNGVIWQSADIPGANRLASVGFAHDLFFTVNEPDWVIYVSRDGLAWTSVPFPQTPRSLNDSDGTVWVIGGDSSNYIAKAVVQKPNAITLAASLKEQKQIVLNFHASVQGDYEIVSAEDLSAESWQAEAEFTEAVGTVTWLDPEPAQNSKFYRVLRR